MVSHPALTRICAGSIPAASVAHGSQRKVPLSMNEAFVSGAEYSWEYAPRLKFKA